MSLFGRRAKNSPAPLIPPVIAHAPTAGFVPPAPQPVPALSAPPVPGARHRPWYRVPERKSINSRPFRDFLRLFLRCHVGMFVLAIFLAYARSSLEHFGQGDSLMFAVAAALLVMLILHIVSTFWLLLWWPFRGTLLWYGGGGFVVAYYSLKLLFESHRPSDSDLAGFLVLQSLWLVIALMATAFLRFHRTYLDRFVQTPEEKADGDIDRVREWAVNFVRDRYAPHAQAIDTYYTEPDLQRDLHHLLHDSLKRGAPTFIHDRANELVTKIERFRAYETVRQACLHEARQIGSVAAWGEIAKEAEVLLSERTSLAAVRQHETHLLHRIRQIAEWHKSHAQPAASPVNTYADIEAAIATGARDDAQPGDSEDDIQREIEFRRRGFRERIAA